MKIKNLVHLVLIFVLLIVSCNDDQKSNTEKEKTPVRPNLLIVLSDQHSYDMIGTYGNEQIITPNLDKFAEEGIRFNNAFTNQPVCTPFRGMLMSGMHPLKNGAFINDVPLLPNESKLLGEILKEKGYQTAYIGKWHLLGGDRDRPIPEGKMRYGFDILLTNNCHVDFRPGKAFFWNEEGQKEYFEKWEVYGQTKQALEFLDTINSEKPFALIVSWHPPHDWGKFKGEDGKMHYRYDTLDELMALYTRDSIKLRPGLEPTPSRKRMYHGYMAMVSGIDKAFGMLMAKLKEKGLEDNTLTIFSADHGDMLESHNAVLPKQYPHGYATHIPLLMKYPSKLGNKPATDLLIGVLDYMPTILGIMDIQTKQEYDGRDLSTAIMTGNENTIDFVPIWNYTSRGTYNKDWRGVITQNYAFAMGNGENPSPLKNILFDRTNDPYQLKNLFQNPNYEKVKDSLKDLTYQWMEKFSDRFYTKKDFERIEPEETWMYNYDDSPYELFKARQTAEK